MTLEQAAAAYAAAIAEQVQFCREKLKEFDALMEKMKASL